VGGSDGSRGVAANGTLPAWAAWNPRVAARPWTVGIEEEVMLLDPDSWQLASRIDDVLPSLSEAFAKSVGAETHGATLELATGAHETVEAAVEELRSLRATLAAELGRLGIRAAAAGTHPFAEWSDTHVSSGPRYRRIHDSMRELARREPTFALHVHVGVPDPEMAARALARLRVHLPLLLALSANSPFWQGRDSGMASVRIPIFDSFPRVGIPRLLPDYHAYVEAVDALLKCGAIPEPTFLWWDARLQPRFGTIEVRVMDAQTTLEDVGALVALVQSLVHLEALEGHAPARLDELPEVLDENRFLAARDGVGAGLLDPDHDRRRPAREWVDEVLRAAEPHAEDLRCGAELGAIEALANDPGHARQRAAARDGDEMDSLGEVTRELAAVFT